MATHCLSLRNFGFLKMTVFGKNQMAGMANLRTNAADLVCVAAAGSQALDEAGLQLGFVVPEKNWFSIPSQAN